jgi:hypothetical protein
MGEGAVGKKRPAWVWVISIFYILSFVYTCVSWYFVLSGSIPVTPQVKAYMEGLTTVDYAVTIIQALTSISGAVALLLLRKAAFHFFCASFLIGLLAMLWQTVARGWLTAMGSMKGGVTGALIGVGITLAVCIYARELLKSGTLT